MTFVYIAYIFYFFISLNLLFKYFLILKKFIHLLAHILYKF